MKRLSFILLMICWCAVGRAGIVRSLDGRTLEGDIKLEEGQVAVYAKKSLAMRVRADNLLFLQMQEPPVLSRGIVLSDGTAFPVDRVSRLDERGVRFRISKGKEQEIDAAQVARIVFAPSADPQEPGAGVVLQNGDFFRGDIASIESNRVSVSSMLFGQREFEIPRQATMVVLRDAQKPKSEVVIKLVDGSVLGASSLEIHRLSLQADQRELQLRDIATISCSSSRLTSLTELLPQSTPATAALLRNLTASRGVVVTADKPLSLRLQGAYRTFTARFAVPRAVLPIGSVDVLISIDGKLQHRIAGNTSISDPTAVVVDLQGAGLLEIAVEASDPLFYPSGLVLDGQFVKQK